MPRDKIIRVGAIVLVLALFLSLLAGAFSVSPAQASPSHGNKNSVQIQQADDTPLGDSIDTDNDGIVNNEDPDIDGDGIVNVNDGDIDGDGVENFNDGDPAATNGFEGKSPLKPGGFTLDELAENGSYGWLILSAFLTIGVAVVILLKTLKKRGKKAQKNL